jgi:hypothetical protein
MTDQGGPHRNVVVPEVTSESPAGGTEDPGEAVAQPAKVMRIGTMVRLLLDEVRQAPLDEASRKRLSDIYHRAVDELGEVLSPDLREELEEFAPVFEQGTAPSESELRIAHAQLVGWLEGLFHGIQAALFAQQMEARSQLEEMRRRGLPRPGSDARAPEQGPGQYL